MSEEIIDGTGKGYTAKVNESNQLEVNAVVIDKQQSVSINEGRAFTFASSFQTLTTAQSFQAVFYLKNTSTTRNLFIQKIGTSSDVSNRWKLIKNPTAGTIVTSAQAGVSTNMNFFSSISPEATVYASGEGGTFTDGDGFFEWINNDRSVKSFNGSLILGVNDSIGVEAWVTSSGGTISTEFQTWYE